jgi:hypothetical protein
VRSVPVLAMIARSLDPHVVPTDATRHGPARLYIEKSFGGSVGSATRMKNLPKACEKPST